MTDIRLIHDSASSSDWTKQARRGNTGSGNPPGGGDMEKRVEKLEQAVYDMQIRLVKIDSRLDNFEKQMATKSDLQELNVSLHKALNEQTGKFIAAAGTMAGLAFAAAKFIHGG